MRARLFHSADFEARPGSDPILDAALLHVREHGWTVESIKRGAADAGYIEATHSMYPRGAFALLQHHFDTARLALVDGEAAFKAEQGTGRRIRALCQARLRRNESYVDRLQDAFALMALPSNTAASLQALHDLSDSMWHIAGDESADMNWYTKRLSLSTVYATTELFMSQDTSPDFADTWAFLDRRLADVHKSGSAVGEIGTFVGFQLWQARNILASKGLRF